MYFSNECNGMETSLQLLIAFLLFLILVGMYFLQGFQNCISTFFNCVFPRAVYSEGASVGGCACMCFRWFADGAQRSGRTSKGARASCVPLADRDSGTRRGGYFRAFCGDLTLSEGPSEFCLGDSPAPSTRSVTTAGSLLRSSERAENRQSHT